MENTESLKDALAALRSKSADAADDEPASDEAAGSLDFFGGYAIGKGRGRVLSMIRALKRWSEMQFAFSYTAPIKSREARDVRVARRRGWVKGDGLFPFAYGSDSDTTMIGPSPRVFDYMKMLASQSEEPARVQCNENHYKTVLDAMHRILVKPGRTASDDDVVLSGPDAERMVDDALDRKMMLLVQRIFRSPKHPPVRVVVTAERAEREQYGWADPWDRQKPMFIVSFHVGWHGAQPDQERVFLRFPIFVVYNMLLRCMEDEGIIPYSSAVPYLARLLRPSDIGSRLTARKGIHPQGDGFDPKFMRAADRDLLQAIFGRDSHVSMAVVLVPGSDGQPFVFSEEMFSDIAVHMMPWSVFAHLSTDQWDFLISKGAPAPPHRRMPAILLWFRDAASWMILVPAHGHGHLVNSTERRCGIVAPVTDIHEHFRRTCFAAIMNVAPDQMVFRPMDPVDVRSDVVIPPLHEMIEGARIVRRVRAPWPDGKSGSSDIVIDGEENEVLDELCRTPETVVVESESGRDRWELLLPLINEEEAGGKDRQDSCAVESDGEAVVDPQETAAVASGIDTSGDGTDRAEDNGSSAVADASAGSDSVDSSQGQDQETGGLAAPVAESAQTEMARMAGQVIADPGLEHLVDTLVRQRLSAILRNMADAMLSPRAAASDDSPGAGSPAFDGDIGHDPGAVAQAPEAGPSSTDHGGVRSDYEVAASPGSGDATGTEETASSSVSPTHVSADQASPLPGHDGESEFRELEALYCDEIAARDRRIADLEEKILALQNSLAEAGQKIPGDEAGICEARAWAEQALDDLPSLLPDDLAEVWEGEVLDRLYALVRFASEGEPIPEDERSRVIYAAVADRLRKSGKVGRVIDFDETISSIVTGRASWNHDLMRFLQTRGFTSQNTGGHWRTYPPEGMRGVAPLTVESSGSDWRNGMNQRSQIRHAFSLIRIVEAMR